MRGHLLRAKGIDCVVLCAHEYQPADGAFPGVDIVRAPLDDNGTLSPFEGTLATIVALDVQRRVRMGQTVLVTCSQGRNRSGFVTALAITMLTGKSGLEAYRLVRRRRRSPFGEALTNLGFNMALMQIPSRPARTHVTKRFAEAAGT
jgi:hypothetical protein